MRIITPNGIIINLPEANWLQYSSSKLWKIWHGEPDKKDSRWIASLDLESGAVVTISSQVTVKKARTTSNN